MPGGLGVIRRASETELDACADLFERVVKDWARWAPAHEITAAFIRPSFDDEEVYLALDEGRLIGFMAFYRPESFVHSLFVERQRSGVGRALLDHAAQIADGSLHLKCATPNEAARAYYAHLGWREVERGEKNGIGFVRLAVPEPG